MMVPGNPAKVLLDSDSSLLHTLFLFISEFEVDIDKGRKSVSTKFSRVCNKCKSLSSEIRSVIEGVD